MAASIIQRPDGRRFLSLRRVGEADYDHEIRSAVESALGPLYLYVDVSDAALHDAVDRAGFVPEVMSNAYQVPFSGVAATHHQQLRHQRSYRLCAADQVPAHELMLLDTALRQDVPGTDGWVSDREVFDDELACAEFDPSGYWVGVEQATGHLVGLVRFWRRQDGPRLGLLAVLREHRGGFLSHRLLQAGLAGASKWGFDAFETHTARPALQRRLERYGGRRTGSFAQMVHRG